MANITEYLKQLQALTNKNLKILSAINQSFFTRKTNTTIQLDNEKYVIPSFLALESKLQLLEDNFENLVNAPKTGVAAFSFDGNTQEIQMKSWSNLPASVQAQNIGEVFGLKENNRLKDFLNPIPYVRLSVGSLPNDITKVIIKKVVFKSDKAQELAKAQLAAEGSTGINISWTDLQALIYSLKPEEYSIYTTITDMPIRDNSKSGIYTIKEISNNYLDDNLDEHWEVYVNEDLKIVNEDGIEELLEVTEADGKEIYLICNEGKTKLLIEKAVPASKYLKFKVLYGSYANLVTTESGETNLSTLEYFNDPKFDEYKYVDVPLEENQYIAVFIDAVNSLNVKSITNSGILYDVYALTNGDVFFKDYYKNVNNIGDKIDSITKLFEAGLESYSQDDYNTLIGIKPESTTFLNEVKQINQHLNNSTTIENIRDLHAQKQQAKKTLEGLRNEIKQLNDLINKIDFNDTTGTRELYESQLQDKQSQYEQTQATITKLVDSISDEANKSVLPIENAKFHVRGFITINEDILTNINAQLTTASQKIDIVGIDVWYRYKNQNSLAGNAMSIAEDYVYSDWNVMPANVSNRTISYEEGTISYGRDYNGYSKNEPCFNQVDIPITQGEIVDVKFRYIYDICYPLATLTSDWSEVVSIDFPVELQENVEILDIVNENNDEVKKNAFDSILTKYGVQDHCADKTKENDAIFWHKADNITSGFYTDEQKVISLKEKLWELNNAVTKVSDEVFGTTVEDLTVTVSNDYASMVLNENADNTFIASSYRECLDRGSVLKYNKTEDNKTVSTKSNVATEQLSLILQNKSNKTLKLYSLFYGKDNDEISVNAKNSKYDIKDYITSWQYTSGTTTYHPVVTPTIFTYSNSSSATKGQKTMSKQHRNQVIYFRLNSPFDDTKYYNTETPVKSTKLNIDASGLNTIRTDKNYYQGWNATIAPGSTGGDQVLNSFSFKPDIAQGIYTEGKDLGTNYQSTLCPFVSNIKSIQLPENQKYLMLAPGEGVKITLLWDFSFGDNASAEFTSKTLSFDVRTSLYEDPKNYTLTVVSNKEQQVQETDTTKNRYNTTIIN